MTNSSTETSDDDTMVVTVLEHTSRHDLICSVKGQTNKIRVDPFVGLAVETNDGNYMEVGDSLVGKTFVMSEFTLHIPIDYPACYLPNNFILEDI